jgi:hypothetical protein
MENNEHETIMKAAKLLGIEPENIDYQTALQTVRQHTLNNKNTRIRKATLKNTKPQPDKSNQKKT